MRRRIYIDPESDLQDNTDKPYLWEDSDAPAPGESFGWCRTGALYDEALWAQYQAATG